MADTAWFEVHALQEERGPNIGTSTQTVELLALQEIGLLYFRAYAPDPPDWRVLKHGIQSVIVLTDGGNRLFVQETYDELRAFVKLKRK